MHILLININPLVSRLISLCANEEHINLEEVHNVNDIVRDRYDVVFVDEASYVDNIQKILANLTIRKKIFLSSNRLKSDDISIFDIIISKPFLPLQIITVLESLEDDDVPEHPIKAPSIFPLPSNEETLVGIQKEKRENAAVLDRDEIEKIKTLLEMDEPAEEVTIDTYEDQKREVIKQYLITDGLELIDEDEYAETLSQKALVTKEQHILKQSDDLPKIKKIKSKKNEDKKSKSKKDQKKKEDIFTRKEALLVAIGEMKVKKIKKLLKGADVTINIHFKDNK